MKFLRSIVIVLALGLALDAHATNKVVTTVSASASTILSPGPRVQIITIANEGSGAVRIGLDGGTTNGGTDPTASSGYLLNAGAQVILTFSGTNQTPKIRAILVTGTTTTLVITTNDTASS
jgi:hypothetical protein